MLTEEEKSAVSVFINKKSSNVPAVFDYGVYIAPSLVFAIYGYIKGDLLAVLVAYGALLLVAILYLSYSRNYTVLLRSALEKYTQMHKSNET